jgi:signal peptide peptidase SppA
MPEYMTMFSTVLHRWAAGESASPEVMAEIEAAQAARAARRQAAANVGGGIAVLPLYGVMTQRASMVDGISGSGGTSTQRFTTAFREAMKDDSVGGIIIDIDSPGGSVFGTGEMAEEIRFARGKKPVFGFINSLCGSAAYWTGAQCSELYITQGGQAGSIGVYMQHLDMSAAMEMKGVKSEFISAGKYKTEGNSNGPLSDEARAFLQSQIDSYYHAFTSAVAKGRDVPIASVRGGMGQGRCLLAADATAEKMVDGVDSFDGVVDRMTRAIRGADGAKASIVVPEIAAVETASTEADAAGVETQSVDPAEAQAKDAAIRAAARRRAMEIASL